MTNKNIPLMMFFGTCYLGLNNATIIYYGYCFLPTKGKMITLTVFMVRNQIENKKLWHYVTPNGKCHSMPLAACNIYVVQCHMHNIDLPYFEARDRLH
jgi:hypothetical protein